MKLYIAYYESYISIIEGKYNHKKEKFNIKNSLFISNEDANIDYSDKYSLLREALKSYKSKTKDVVLCLNTKDIIIKSTEIHKAKPKDLDGIMNNEMDEIMSLDFDRNTFSYEVTNDDSKEDKENLDVVVAAIENEELEKMLDIFKEFKLNLQRIDTISTAYNRLLKKIEYNNVLMLNVGNYGSIVNIFKNDSLFIHDNIPVKISKSSNEYVYSSLVEEIKGLINYYSSRNYGENIDTIVLVGQSYENKYIKEYFEQEFSSNIICGIENLFDIENDISGDLNTYEISQASDVLGSMCCCENKKEYSKMNLLPTKLKNKQKSRNSIKQIVMAAPVALGIIFAPYIVFGAMNLRLQDKINENQAQLDGLTIEYQDVEKTKSEIKAVQEEIEIYKMLKNKSAIWGDILDVINKSIPYRADLINVNVYYDEELAKQKEENKDEQNDVNNEESSSENEEQTPIYDQVPNIIELDGEAKNSYHVGQFVYNLNKIPYFKSVQLKSTNEDKEKGVQQFSIVLVLEEGVVHGE